MDAKTDNEIDSLHYNLKKITTILKDKENGLSNSNRGSFLWHNSMWGTRDSINPLITEEALIWIDEAIILNPSYDLYEIKSKLLIKLERWREAKTAALKSKSLYIEEIDGDQDDEYLLEIEDRLELINEELQKKQEPKLDL